MEPNRKFLQRVLESGLECHTLSAQDITVHATPDVLAAHLPVALKAKLLAEALAADAMNPELILRVLGVEQMARHLPQPVLWGVVRDAAERSIAGTPKAAASRASTAKPASRTVSGTLGGSRVPLPPPAAPLPAPAPAPAPAPVATRTPRDQFDVDTNPGDWADDFDDEADALGAATDAVLEEVVESYDWSPDEKTDTTGILDRRKR